MGLLKKFRQWGSRFRGTSRPAPNERALRRGLRICRLERMESRQLLSVVPPIQVGSVYFEDNTGKDEGGDRF